METQMNNRIGNRHGLAACRPSAWYFNPPVTAILMIGLMSLASSVTLAQEDRLLNQINDHLLVDGTVAGCACNADVNGDTVIDGVDLAAVGNCTLGDCSGCTATNCDVNCDGIVDQSDVDAADCMFIGGTPTACCGAQKCAPIGNDCFTTACDGKTTYDFNNSPIPAGFFGTNQGVPSDPFTGIVTLGGPGNFPGDTIIRRMQQMCFPDPQPVTQTIPIEIVQLDLVSCQPITVTYGTAPPLQWDVFIQLDPNNPSPPGDMTATKTHADGGTYSANLPVNAAAAFGPAGSGTPTTALIPVLQVVLSTVCDGVWGQGNMGCGSGFAPGWNLTVPNIPCCQETCHASGILGHLHCTTPPDCTPCVPDPTEDCNDGIDNDGDGLCDCADPDCDNSVKCLPPYENWVIADDFKLKCAKCQCDFDGDGVCTTADLAFAQTCFQGSGVGCEQVDYDCNGLVDIVDIGVLQCLMAGNPAADCCPNQDLTIDRMRWYGSYFDTDFEPPAGATTSLRDPDSWFVSIHRDIPATSCPAPPAGLAPVDLCGTLEVCPDGTGSWVFTPNGSAVSYSLVDGGGALATYAAGDEVRICGHVDTSLTPCVGSNATIVVNAAMVCGTKVSRPGELVVQWVVDDASVLREEPFKIGCDGHRIFRYTSNIDTWCLEHDNSLPGEIDAAGVFHPLANRVYWVSYQAVVGMTVAATCNIIKTGEVAVKDFWGWHTTPPGYQHIDDAYVGMLHMGCPDEWVYDWVHHLHCSDPTYKDCCQDPTKSIDMAFQLFRGDLMVWNQPVNPGPPNTPFPPLTPIPGGGIDEYTETQLFIVINLPGFPDPLNLTLIGPTVIARSDPSPPAGGTGQRTVQTEILSMDLSGIDPTGSTLTVRNLGSSGKDGVRINPGGPPHTGTMQIQIEIVELELRSAGPIPLEAEIWEFPPSETPYQTPPDYQPVDLIDINGNPVGSIKFVQHWLPYNGGVNIHSDVNWTTIPSDPCCEPNAAGDACVGTCDDPTLTCLPTVQQCDPATGLCVIIDCDCIDGPPPPDDCHLVDVPGQIPPFDCVGTCQSPPWPIGTTCDLIQIVNADGTVTHDCRCAPEETGACCDLANNVCYFSTALNCPAPSIFHANADCDPIGTCCVDTDGDGFMDRCSDMAEVCCKDIAGSAFHPNTTCDPQGLCCYDSDNNGTLDRCDNVAESCCQDNGGIFHVGLDCTSETQAECCIDTDGDGFVDSCEFISQTCCNDSGGSWIGGGDCTQQALCCYDKDGDGINEACDVLSKECCHVIPGATFATGTSCSTPQSCCINDTCVMIDRSCCVAQGGVVGPAGTVCTGPQACCDPTTGACSVVDPLCCELSGGISSTFAACQGDGACCNPITGTCTDVDQLCCSLSGGSPQGVGIACSATPEACCMADGTCTMLDPLCCQDQGGNPQGPGVTCSTQAACCLPDGTCGMLDPLCCLDQGGSPQAAGAVCSGVLEACCMPDGTCELLERLCCEDAGGVAQGGVTSCTADTCVQDVCEPDATGMACNDVVCPIAGEKCLPLGVICDAAGCMVTGCECQPDVCPIEIDAGTSLPNCVNSCPSADDVCTLYGVDTNGDGIDNLFRCECAPAPPLPDPNTPGALACGGGSNYGLPCMTCSGGSRDGLLCLSDSDCTGGGVCLPNNSLCPGASCGGVIAGPGTTLAWPKNRYSGFDANPLWAGTMMGIRVTLVSVDGHPNCAGVTRWAGHPAVYCEGGACANKFFGSKSQATPHFMDWTTVGGPVQIFGEEFVPNSLYAIQAVGMISGTASAPLMVQSAKWGDVDIPMFPFTAATQPAISDVLKIVDKWLGFLQPVKVRAQLQPQFVNPATSVSIADVLKCVDAWLGTPYPFPVSTAACP